MIPEQTTAIILAAGVNSAWMSAVTATRCPAMVPVSGRPVVHWTLDYLRRQGLRRAILGVRPEEHRLPRFVRQAFGKTCDIRFETITEDRGPGYTLLCCLRRVAAGSPVLVVLGDTIFRFGEEEGIFSRNLVLTAEAPDAARWCLADVDATGRVRRLVDKPAENPGNWPALIGVYYFCDKDPAERALEAKAVRARESLQISDALRPYFESDQGGPELYAREAGQWLDCGNPDFLSSSRRRLLEARDFNEITLDSVRGTITKRSRNTEKFIDEINYYRLLPQDVAVFFPRLLSFSISPSDPSVTMEYYGYSTLSEKWVFEELDARHWREIFELLSKVLECFAEHPMPVSGEVLTDIYWGKTLSRIGTFRGQSESFRELVDREKVLLNGRTLQGWPMLQRQMEDKLPGILGTARGGLIHGDFCFSNILYDPVSHLIKLIDPRGSFGRVGIYGDVQYDMAKLMHSLEGGYDFIVQDMFELTEGTDGYGLSLFLPDHQEEVWKEFERVFSGRYHFEHARLVEALLFLSMCPLHAGKPERQKAMWLTGLRLANEVLKL